MFIAVAPSVYTQLNEELTRFSKKHYLEKPLEIIQVKDGQNGGSGLPTVPELNRRASAIRREHTIPKNRSVYFIEQKPGEENCAEFYPQKNLAYTRFSKVEPTILATVSATCLLMNYLSDYRPQLLLLKHKKNVFCLHRCTSVHQAVALSDVCETCVMLIRKNTRWTTDVSRVMLGLEALRPQLLRRTRLFEGSLMRMEISGPRMDFWLMTDEPFRIPMTPLEKTVYLLFMVHREGLYLHELKPMFEWLCNQYKQIAPTRNRDTIRNHIKSLVDASENSIYEKMSRIRKKLSDAGGELFAERYAIRGERNGLKKINTLPFVKAKE